MAEHPGGLIVRDLALLGPGGRDRRHPLQRTGLVHLHTQARGRGDDLLQVLLCLMVGHVRSPSVRSARIRRNNSAWRQGILECVMRQRHGDSVSPGNCGERCLRPTRLRTAHVERLDVQRTVPERVPPDVTVQAVGHEHPVERGVEPHEHGAGSAGVVASTHCARRWKAADGSSPSRARRSMERPLTASADPGTAPCSGFSSA